MSWCLFIISNTLLRQVTFFGFAFLTKTNKLPILFFIHLFTDHEKINEEPPAPLRLTTTTTKENWFSLSLSLSLSSILLSSDLIGIALYSSKNKHLFCAKHEELAYVSVGDRAIYAGTWSPFRQSQRRTVARESRRSPLSSFFHRWSSQSNRRISQKVKFLITHQWTQSCLFAKVPSFIVSLCDDD